MTSRYLAHFLPEAAGVETATAQPAEGTGSAHDATVVIFGNGRAELASGTGGASNPYVSVSANAGHAAGIGAASDAIATTIPAVTRTGGTFSVFANADTSPQSVAFTLPAGSNYLVAMVSTFSTVTITSMTWKPDSGNAGADQAMTLIATSGTNFTGAGTTHIWGLANPTATVLGSVIEHSLSSATKRVMGVHALSGVVSIGPPATTTGDDPSMAVVSTYKALVLDVLRASNSTGTYTPGTLQSEHWDVGTTGGVNNLRGAGSQEVGNSPTTTMSWTTSTGTIALLGVSFNPTPQAGVATGTGTAYGAAVGGQSLTANAGLATGTGTAQSPRPLVKPRAGVASGIGSAAGPDAAIASRAGLAAATGAGLDASFVISGDAANVDAGAASGTGSAYDASTRTSPRAELASGIGAAYSASAHVSLKAGVAATSGQAYGATPRTGRDGNAELVTASGVAYDASVAIVQPVIRHASFGLDAHILSTGQHDRIDFHYGTQPDTVITYGAETLDVVLARLFETVVSVTDPNTFRLYAYVADYSATGATFGVDAYIFEGHVLTMNAIIHKVWRTDDTKFTMSAVFIALNQAWNLVRTPRFGATASYSASSSQPLRQPPLAADGVLYGSHFGVSTASWSTFGVGAIGDWWQVTWDGAQSINRVIIYDGGRSLNDAGEVVNSASRVFGDTGVITFSDGSSIPYTGFNFAVLTFDFAHKSVTWIRITSTTAGGSNAAWLAELEAYDTEQWD